ncbi:PQQ-binding-like beta-propeller repeat protein [Acuticoccus sp. M5D2P5]|uniref:pyrroloquinoline quinone-dependent dehydrogenase n=1 Tax=Acuticoccus kalidii TaxID=2910977 RepID=UPI001F416B57|nr:pyrroloquinoline quinone-dependent dehydrogenase [Acuticoccus kalidii]MCF3935558.1 PQQ-binding-like beta-propeller repeat protein [Acuticoccus kalidii]
MTRHPKLSLFVSALALTLAAPAVAQDTAPPAATTEPSAPTTTDPATPASPAETSPPASSESSVPDASSAGDSAASETPTAPETATPADAAATDTAETPTTPADTPEADATAEDATPSAETAEEAPADTATETAPPSAGQTTVAPEGEAMPTAETAPTGTGDSAAAETPQSMARNAAPQPEVGTDWPFYGGDAHALRYSPLDQITRDNVGQLERAFVYRTGDMPSEAAAGKYAPETTPLKVGDALLMCSAMNILISIDAATGEENWRYDPQVSDDAIPYSASCRGVSIYTDPDAAADAPCATRVIEATLDARLVAVDTATGEVCADFGENGEVDLWDGIGERVPGWYAVTAPPAIVRGIVVTGAQVKDGQAEDAPSGVVRGYDAVTGELAWAWDLGAPEANKDGPPEGETYTRGTPNMWTAATGDEELGYVYLPMGNSSVDYYGSNRSEQENEYSTSLVAIDVTTGDPVWTFQTVHRDVWDYDLGSQVSLIDFPADDGPVPAIVLPSKQGDIYILNRETGESLFPVGSIEAPTVGSVEPDYLSGEQPVSEYHTLRKADLTERDMWGFTPIDQMVCRILFKQANYAGFFTPPSTDRPWIQFPGYNGGSDWGSVAIDPERGVIIANYNNIPNHNRLLTREQADERGLRPINEQSPGESGGSNAEGAGDPQAGSPYAIDVNAGWRAPGTGVPCTRPPYGGIRAIDLKTGETLWDTPLGTARRNGPFGIPSYLPFKIGTPNNGGSVVTAGGLVFIAAATDNLFRAIDIETGETVWEDLLPAGGQANPMAYEVDGRQYILIAPGGHHFMETPIGDYVIAYALPQN